MNLTYLHNTEQQAFEKEIFADPDNDSLRLIYADWLDERGDPRGEFIREQVYLSQISKYEQSYWDVKARCEDLLAYHEDEWVGKLPDFVDDYEFVRGFPHKVVCSPEKFLANHQEIFKCTFLTQLAFREFDSDDLSYDGVEDQHIIPLMEIPQIKQLRTLKIHTWTDNFTYSGVEQLFKREQLHRLQSFCINSQTPGYAYDSQMGNLLKYMEGFSQLKDFRFSGMGVRNGINELVNTKFFTQLESLDLRCNEIIVNDSCNHLDSMFLSNVPFELSEFRIGYNHISRLGIELILNSPNFSNLRIFDFANATTYGDNRNNFIVSDLIKSKQLSKLSSLDLSGIKCSDEGYIQLFREGKFSNLKELILDMTPLVQEALNGLFENSTVSQLVALDLRLSEIDSVSMEKLTNASFFQNLRELNISYNRIKDKGVECLLQSSLLNRIRSFDLSGTKISQQGVFLLTQDPRVENLRSLSLASNEIQDDGMYSLANCNYFQELASLNLYSIRCTELGVRSLANSSAFPMLQSLCLGLPRGVLAQGNFNQMGDHDAIEAFATTKGFPKLKELDLRGWNPRERVRKRLELRWGDKLRMPPLRIPPPNPSGF